MVNVDTLTLSAVRDNAVLLLCSCQKHNFYAVV